uniref:Chaperone binding protein n=1 Tax=Rhizophora mucronata TaxID=61149 RepID=A0A2P2LFJ7_RHIMU
MPIFWFGWCSQWYLTANVIDRLNISHGISICWSFWLLFWCMTSFLCNVLIALFDPIDKS